jgi:SAM-dependent methyltransferase
MMSKLDSEYWTERYLKSETGWDVGEATPPIKQYLDQIENKEIKILIPGAGNAYEAVYAFNNGFTNTHILDLSPVPIGRFKIRYPLFPVGQIHLGDFFEHDQQYDLILEQTFFCALDPSLRSGYAQKIKSILKPGGKLAGVMFDRLFERQGPPFGGSREEYLELFSPHFEIVKIESCYNSILPRVGSEVFTILKNA